MTKVKKPFYKKWWFITIVLFVVIGVAFSPSAEEREEAEMVKAADSEKKAEEKKLKKEERESEKVAKENVKLEEKQAKELAKEEKKESEEKKKAVATDEKEAVDKSDNEPKEEPVKIEAPEVAKKEKATEPKEKEKKPDPIDRTDDLEKVVQSIIKDVRKTSIKDVLVNKNMGLGDGSYIVLPHLEWKVKNSAKTTREMLEMYSDDIAAKIADESDVSEVTIFWEVPHHLKDNNVAKFAYERGGDDMLKGEVWFAPLLKK